MNEQIFFDLGQQRYNDDIARGEANYKRQTATVVQSSGPRLQLAISLINLASRIQPSLSVQVEQPAQPATA
jgi:hypothetical protein